MSNTSTATGGTATRRGAGRQRIVTVVVATLATVVVWLLAHSAFGVDIEVKTNGSASSVQLPAVIFATLVSGLLAWALIALLERRPSGGRKAWVIIAVVVFLLSLVAGPGSGVTTSAKIALACLHTVAALVLVPGLARTVRKG
ncbi:DUF6069 family protein [Streptomyces sp. NBC_01267]|uniref:DUF6069 family protein n=1 Tax=unclassified Streptomyces TaxID=2593676 RepID=UPI002025A8EE|nr:MULTISPECIES: DUF6069 family protein [unclassified Streptomyces]MCX4547600.1 DUF6069 family protein [Streptomyces sp. NBC_01500]WSC19286.1 DUF6069 family protein [Streptomyces sp. NBC_01766]WSV53309.1 DUF6069 family protein [Streptomyces sp. NBC_01014]